MTVEIHCPHCGFSKTIPDEKIPAGVKWANCPRCRNRFQLILPETVPVPEETQEGAPKEPVPRREAPPWENWTDLGLMKALYRTTKAVLFSPRGLFRMMEFRGGLKGPLLYGLLSGSLGAMVGLFWQFLVMFDTLHSLTSGYFEDFGLGFLFTLCLVLSPVYVVVSLYLMSLVVHGCLLLVRGGKNGFEATFRVMAYSQGTQFLAFVPILGGLVALVWQLMVQLIGLREIHEISYGRIVLASLIPFGLFLILVVMVVLMLPSLVLRF